MEYNSNNNHNLRRTVRALPHPRHIYNRYDPNVPVPMGSIVIFNRYVLTISNYQYRLLEFRVMHLDEGRNLYVPQRGINSIDVAALIHSIINSRRLPKYAKRNRLLYRKSRSYRWSELDSI